jgi:hypothetical protein
MNKSRSRKAVAGRVAKLPAAARPRAVRPAAGCQIHLGVLVGWDDRGPLVELDGRAGGPVRARVSSPGGASFRPAAAAGAALSRPEVVLLIDPRPGRAPVLLGVLQSLTAETPAGASELEARVDGRRVEIDGRDEIVLRCGPASITLRRNGRVLIRGVQVETRASGVNRIKGGSVAIN